MNVILSVFLTKNIDPQRNIKWPIDYSILQPFLDSVSNYKSIIFTDELDGESNIIKIDESSMITNPYFKRWELYSNYLKSNLNIDYVWVVDSTDVVLLKDPFNFMKKKTIYCGFAEPGETLGSLWMINNHPFHYKWLINNKEKLFLNDGVVGSDRKTMINLCDNILDIYSKSIVSKKELLFDLSAFNYLVYNDTKINLITDNIVSDFKKYDLNSSAIWRHK